MLGNSVKALNETQFAPIFLGIAVGVCIGMIPIYIPGVPFPVKFGLAGGPLAAAIIFSLIGSIGRIVWYLPFSANMAMRELGILLFLACVGVHAGQSFFSVALTASGALWILAGLVVTMVPLLTTGLIAHYFGKLNFLTISGVVAGSMTDPPALAFANSLADSEACSTAYAAVYPLTMIMRIVAAQVIVYVLAG
jgi:putative transport protein